MYNLPDYDIVVKAIKANYDEYFAFITNSKLLFVKKLKEDTGLGLKEAKYNADIIFRGGKDQFRRNFHLKEQRKMKLEQLKVKLFTRELVTLIKSKDEEELVDIFSTMKPKLLEKILKKLLND